MTAIEIARAFAARGETGNAQEAYQIAIQKNRGEDPAVDLEAALYLFQSGGDYKISYTLFRDLYNAGYDQSGLFDLMVQAFYAPNVKEQEKRYRRNCKLLGEYPDLFRRDFLPFDELPVKFFPFDDDGFLPFFTGENRFGDYVNFSDPVISRNFFYDLENPILASDVYSQYELEYLNDNVRKSEWVARENHVYLHYTDWTVFCSHLQVLDFRPLLGEEKLVFLMEDERSLYPIDFKARFGIDYGQYEVKPFSVREVKRLIWHTQLSSHNGGDFFNEIFHGHPNLLAKESIMFDSIEATVAKAKKWVQTQKTFSFSSQSADQRVIEQLYRLRDLTDKDIFTAMFLSDLVNTKNLDRNARIAPTLFFQPHFSNLYYTLDVAPGGKTVLDSPQYEHIRRSPIFQGFKYIKTFTPMRRMTTSYGATVKFSYERAQEAEKHSAVGDAISNRLLNRSFMIDVEDRLYHDSVLVRFEDGKLNPKATFTTLAAFLDLPYTESLTYCSGATGINPESLKGNALGFDPSTIYRTYDDYANDAERCFLEYFMRDAYEYYGYDFHYYDGAPMDEERARALIAGFATLNDYMMRTLPQAFEIARTDGGEELSDERRHQIAEDLARKELVRCDENRLRIATTLMHRLDFVNKRGQPLRMMPRLRLDPALLEQPLYH